VAALIGWAWDKGHEVIDARQRFDGRTAGPDLAPTRLPGRPVQNEVPSMRGATHRIEERSPLGQSPAMLGITGNIRQRGGALQPPQGLSPPRQARGRGTH
jgi:hypothetical protein